MTMPALGKLSRHSKHPQLAEIRRPHSDCGPTELRGCAVGSDGAAQVTGHLTCSVEMSTEDEKHAL